MVKAIRNHYVPIMRVLMIAAGEAGAAPDKADLNTIIACALLFRRKINYLMDENGGFYFRNHRGEELCATLSNLLSERFYALSGAKPSEATKQTFQENAEKLTPVNSINQVRQTLNIGDPEPGPFAQLCTDFKAKLGEACVLDQLKVHVVFLQKVLDHE